MRRAARIALFLLMLVQIAAVQAQDAPAEEERTLIPPDQAILQDMFERINRLRERRGLQPYMRNASLDAAAQDQAEWLVSTGWRGHYRRDGSRPSTRAAQFGFVSQDWCCGENYYMSIDATPDMVFDFWRWSPSHVVNMVHRDFTDIGLGMSSDGYRISYVTVFGERYDPNAQPPASEASAEAASAEQRPQDQPPPDAPAQLTHLVVPGDTLAAISIRYGVTISAIATANQIADPSLIYIGQVLRIPVETTTGG